MAFSGPKMCDVCCNHENRNLVVKSVLLKKGHYLELICYINILTITTWLSYRNRDSPQKVSFYGPNMCNICRYHENRSFLVNSPRLKKWHYLDLMR